jgi:hypothetical protein
VIDPGIKGFKAALACLAHLPTPSVLSDILNGRNAGSRYRESLARQLHVSAGWLAGDDLEPPDWRLPPLEAFRRWRAAVEAAWRGRIGDGCDDESDSALMAARGPSGPLEQALERSPGDPLILQLQRGEWRRVPFPDLERLARGAGLPVPLHRAHLLAGHAQAEVLERQLESEAGTLVRRSQRLELPPSLFAETRAALVGRRRALLAARTDVTAVEDALELLWRRQRRQMPADQALAGLCQDTGRGEWTPLRELRGRHGG